MLPLPRDVLTMPYVAEGSLITKGVLPDGGSMILGIPDSCLCTYSLPFLYCGIGFVDGLFT